MVIQLSSDAEALVQQLVERGAYDDAEAVIEEALRLLEQRDQLARLKAAIAIGVEQAERGQVVPWTPDLLPRLNREAAALASSGAPIKDEVKP